MDAEFATGEVTLSVDGSGIATVELHRPPDNFFDTALVGGIADAFEHADADPACRVILLCAEGKHFCAGAALGGSGDAGSTGGRHVYDDAARIFRSTTPVVAAVHGAAVGGGLGLAMAADVRIAATSARLAANFAALGFHHGFGLTVTLPWVIGSHHATRVLLEARRLSAVDARELGMVDHVVDDGELRSAALDAARRIARNAPLAVTSIRATMRAGLAERAIEAMVHERAEQYRLSATDDFAEGVAAMSARREPVFHAR